MVIGGNCESTAVTAAAVVVPVRPKGGTAETTPAPASNTFTSRLVSRKTDPPSPKTPSGTQPQFWTAAAPAFTSIDVMFPLRSASTTQRLSNDVAMPTGPINRRGNPRRGALIAASAL